jgi:hypothetical protein
MLLLGSRGCGLIDTDGLGGSASGSPTSLGIYVLALAAVSLDARTWGEVGDARRTN